MGFVYIVFCNLIKKIVIICFYLEIYFFSFAVYVIAIYCFSFYILAMVSSALSVIFSIWLVVLLFKNNQYFLMSLLAVLVVLYLYFLFYGVLCCSLEYGVWKD